MPSPFTYQPYHTKDLSAPLVHKQHQKPRSVYCLDFNLEFYGPFSTLRLSPQSGYCSTDGSDQTGLIC